MKARAAKFSTSLLLLLNGGGGTYIASDIKLSSQKNSLN